MATVVLQALALAFLASVPSATSCTVAPPPHSALDLEELILPVLEMCGAPPFAQRCSNNAPD